MFHERREGEHDGLVGAPPLGAVVLVDPEGRGHGQDQDEGQAEPGRKDAHPHQEGERTQDVGVDLFEIMALELTQRKTTNSIKISFVKYIDYNILAMFLFR